MLRIVLIVALGAVLWWALYRWRRTPVEQKRQEALKLTLIAVAAVCVVLTLLGRVHWLTGAFAALLPWLRSLVIDRRVLALVMSWFHGRARGDSNGQAPIGTSVDRQDAFEILGLMPGASEDDIIRRHRQLMQKVHPDREGSAYLAAQINAARDAALESVRRG
ncbi:DnaJ domain-containing protein [Gammaproteobacteria bacterium]|nr:DnaJ domain-containing protein [Gammaproteobacteria bacterium]